MRQLPNPTPLPTTVTGIEPWRSTKAAYQATKSSVSIDLVLQRSESHVAAGRTTL